MNQPALANFGGDAVPVLEGCKGALHGGCARRGDKLFVSDSSSSEGVAGAAEEKQLWGMAQLGGEGECWEEDVSGGLEWPL